MTHRVYTYTKETQVQGHRLHLGLASEADAIETVQHLLNYLAGPAGRNDDRIGIVIKRGDEVVWHWERERGLLGTIGLTVPGPMIPTSLIVDSEPAMYQIKAFYKSRTETWHKYRLEEAYEAAGRLRDVGKHEVLVITIRDPWHDQIFKWRKNRGPLHASHPDLIPKNLQGYNIREALAAEFGIHIDRVMQNDTGTWLVKLPEETTWATAECAREIEKHRRARLKNKGKVMYMGLFTTEKPQPKTRIYVEMEGGCPAVKATNDEECCTEQTIGFIGPDGALHLKRLGLKAAETLKLAIDTDRYIQVVREQ